MTRPRRPGHRGVWSGALGADDRAAKLVDTMVRALVDTGRTEFVDGGIGSSIMMGHDNW